MDVNVCVFTSVCETNKPYMLLFVEIFGVGETVFAQVGESKRVHRGAQGLDDIEALRRVTTYNTERL